MRGGVIAGSEGGGNELSGGSWSGVRVNCAWSVATRSVPIMSGVKGGSEGSGGSGMSVPGVVVMSPAGEADAV